MKDIVLIAPFKDLYDLSKKIIKNRGYNNIEVILGDLSEGVIQAKKVVAKGARVIISRGGTYTMIKNVVGIPVVQIKITSFDILRGFKDIINYKGTIGAAGYSNIIEGCESIKDILDLDIVKINIDEEEGIEEKLKPYVEKGVKVFVGDTIGSRVTKRLKCKSYIITSGEEAIIDAMQEARRILQISKIEKEKTEQFKTIMDFVHDGIIAVDEKGKLTIFNSMAQKIFGVKERDALGRHPEKLIKNSKLEKVLNNGKVELGEIQEVGKSKIATNRVPIVVDNEIKGVVATFQDITELQNLEKKVRLNLSKKGFIAKYHFDHIIHKSNRTKLCIEKGKKYSKFDSPVLITGPSGVGKELFAQSIHNCSNRRKGPFVAINCAALPPNLIESELFGYAEGAFTGALKGGKSGIFELAHGGTIFLDEIGELPMEIQGRLLRVLQEREVMRIGDNKVIPVDVRIISATNKNINKMVEEGKFREDLYFRINILILNIPPLNKRKEDIEQLSNFFIKKYCSKYSKYLNGISEDALNYLLNYNYRGNVRELQGIIERGVILSEGDKLEFKDVDLEEENEINELEDNELNKNTLDKEEIVFKVHNRKSLKEVQKEYIEYTLQRCNGSIKEASSILNVNRSTIWRNLKKS